MTVILIQIGQISTSAAPGSIREGLIFLFPFPRESSLVGRGCGRARKHPHLKVTSLEKK